MTNERTKFEAWATMRGFGMKKVPTEGNRYVSDTTQAAWEGYQAALASQQKPVAGLDEVALRVMNECRVDEEWRLNLDPKEFATRLVAELTKGRKPWKIVDHEPDGEWIDVQVGMEVIRFYAAPIPAVPTGWKLVGWLDGRGRFFYADDPMYKNRHEGMREVFAAAPEVKP